MESEKTKRKPVLDMNAGNEPSSCDVNLKPRVFLCLNLVLCLSCDSWLEKELPSLLVLLPL